ncbi:MAG TPA: hypothetical protein DEO95_11335 [Ruminococcaceae bacterium]|nr:hypothetical protein [Oscillospiraceae bacterium]
MQRNRILYFIIGVVLIIVGYIVRVTDLSIGGDIEEKKFAMEGSFVFITMGMYFIVAVVFRKAAAWVVGGVSFLLVAFLQLFRKMEFGWYNSLYESEVGRIIIGGPFEFRLFIYILIGMVLGAALELVLRQYNQIGLSD